MKKILQALDGASAKPVEGSNDMKKFLTIIVKEAALAIPQQDPNFVKYSELMAKYDMLSAEMNPDANGVAKNSSPEFIQQVNALKSQADKLAGTNAQAWEQARKAGNTPQQSNAQLATQLEDAGMNKLLSIVSESKGPLNRPTTAESIAMQHYTKKTITNPVLNVQEGAKPSMIGKYFKAVEQEFAESAERSKERSGLLAEVIAKKVLKRNMP